MPVVSDDVHGETATLSPPSPDWYGLFDGLCVYQDVLWAGRTVLQGVRDVESRWRLIAPHLPQQGVFLDVGSNFGWYGLTLARTRPGSLVLSIEADERSARVQRQVLASHAIGPVCLATRRATAAQCAQMQAVGQRFDAAFCLSVLHWMPDHREFLSRLAAVAEQIFVELPGEGERNVGLAQVRREIGPPERHLRELLPRHQVVKLGEIAAHDQDHTRALWRVTGDTDPLAHVAQPTGLDVDLLLDLGLSWPPRIWWQGALQHVTPPGEHATACGRARLISTDMPGHVAIGWYADAGPYYSLHTLRRRLRRLPENTLWTRGESCHRHLRRAAGRYVRAARTYFGRASLAAGAVVRPVVEGKP